MNNQQKNDLEPLKDHLLHLLRQKSRLYLIPHNKRLKTDPEYALFSNLLLETLISYATLHGDSMEYVSEAYNQYYLEFVELQSSFNKTGAYRYDQVNSLEKEIHGNFYKDYIYILLISFLTTYYRYSLSLFIDQFLKEKSSETTFNALEIGFGTGVDFLNRKQYFENYQVYDKNEYSGQIFNLLMSDNEKITYKKQYYHFDEEEKYNYVQLIELLEHVENPESYINDSHKVLQKGGYLVFTAAVNMANIDHVFHFSNWREVEQLIDPKKWEIVAKNFYINSLYSYSKEEETELIESHTNPYITVHIIRKL